MNVIRNYLDRRVLFWETTQWESWDILPDRRSRIAKNTTGTMFIPVEMFLIQKLQRATLPCK